MKHLRKYPLFVLVLMIGAIAMLIPAAHAARQENWLVARTFFQISLLILAFCGIVGLSMMNRTPRNAVRSNLVTLILCFTILPVFLALPLMQLVPSLGFLRAYFEMLSSLTTTGATLIDKPSSIAESLHLWRAMVAWLGGFLVLLSAMTIMEPMNIGGFELRTMMNDKSSKISRRVGGSHDGGEKIIGFVKMLAPAYGVFTAILALLLIMSGERVFIAVIHAMSVISTSGISPVEGLSQSNAGYRGEFWIALFMLLAISSRTMNLSQGRATLRGMPKDPEYRLMAIVVIGVPTVLFLRHWIAAFEVNEGQNLMAGIHAFWGAMFTVLSFMTTTGFQSADWHASQSWSGLPTPGIILFGLAVMGGGIATTAGGVKLLRIYALYKHGMREMERLVHPSSVGRSGLANRRFRRQGAEIAWIFLMIFILGIAVVTALLSLTGLTFEKSLALSIAGLSNTGPLLFALGDPSANYANLSDTALSIMSAAMILGRLEALALIALFNPDYWRQ
ncbi:MAG: TrkH family potassium uptake protein [Rhodobacteraceae bacterium]|nr:TrkH family potassium uptake protein [Paracoccaceae bacterium]